jgi:hypothetical protein
MRTGSSSHRDRVSQGGPDATGGLAPVVLCDWPRPQEANTAFIAKCRGYTPPADGSRLVCTELASCGAVSESSGSSITEAKASPQNLTKPGHDDRVLLVRDEGLALLDSGLPEPVRMLARGESRSCE